MSGSMSPKFRVAICGGGIGGLVLAITIAKYDPSIPIEVYEAQGSIETAGVGITVWRQAHEVMIELGLFDEFKQIFTQSLENKLGPGTRRSDIREGGYLWYQAVHRYGPTSMHRQHMVAILERNLPASCTAHTGKRLINYTKPERQDGDPMSSIGLEFADGTTATTDVLIGADGIHSAVRKTMFETASQDSGDDEKDLKQYIDATFTEIMMYRCLVPAEALRKEDPENLSLREMSIYAGKGRSLVTYPIAKGTVINTGVIVADPGLVNTHYDGHWVSDASHEQLVEWFDDFEPDVRTVVKLCEKPTKWALLVTKPLPFCVRGRVALIGDACHAMAPQLGAGAGQAIEDAFVLGRLISHPLTTLHRIQAALGIYEEIRFPIARTIADLSLSTAWMNLFMAPGYYDGTRREDDLDEMGISAYEREGMETLKQEILRRSNWMDELSGALPAWTDAELKLQALANDI